MPILTHYECPKCGKIWSQHNDGEQPVAIRMQIAFGKTIVGSVGSFGSSQNTYDTFWCRECIMKAGIVAPTTVEDKAVAPEQALTLEDKIVMLFKELGFVTRDEV